MYIQCANAAWKNCQNILDICMWFIYVPGRINLNYIIQYVYIQIIKIKFWCCNFFPFRKSSSTSSYGFSGLYDKAPKEKNAFFEKGFGIFTCICSKREESVNYGHFSHLWRKKKLKNNFERTIRLKYFPLIFVTVFV